MSELQSSRASSVRKQIGTYADAVVVGIIPATVVAICVGESLA